MRIGDVVQVGEREIPGWQPSPDFVPEHKQIPLPEKAPEKEPEKVD